MGIDSAAEYRRRAYIFQGRVANNPGFSTKNYRHRYPKAYRAWMRANPDKPLPWSYFDVNGMQVDVNDLALNHPAREWVR